MALLLGSALRKILGTSVPSEPPAQPQAPMLTEVTPQQVIPDQTQSQQIVDEAELGPVSANMIPEGAEPTVPDVPRITAEADDQAAEAQQFMSTGIEGYDTTASFQPNFNTINTDDDAKAVVAGLAEKYGAEIDEARRGVVHDEQLHAMAQELGTDPQFISKFLQRQTGEAVNAETIIASRHVLHESGRKLKTMAQKIMSMDATDAEKMEFHRQWDFHRQFMTQFMGARAEIGRAMRSYGVPLGSQQFQLARQNEVQETLAQRFDIYEVAEQVLNTDDFAGLNNVVKNQSGGMSKGGAAMVEYFTASVLSGAKTHIVNSTGNALMTLTGPIETAIATRMGRATPDGMVAGEASAQMFGLLSTFRSAMNVAWKVAKTGEPYQGVAKFETPHGKAISGEALGLSGPWGWIADVTGVAVRAPLERVMGPIDGFFMHMNEGAKTAQLAYREAVHRKQAEGLSDAEFLQVLEETMSNPPQHIREAAVDYGIYNMAATPLGETGRKIQTAVNSNAGAKLILPFVRTPTNLVKMAFVDRSPLGLASKKVREDIMGKNGEDAARYARARMTFGSMFGASVTAYAANGMLTGGGPKDPNARKDMMAKGWRPNSMVMTNPDGSKTWVSYDRTEPLGYLIGTIADLYEWSSASQYDSYDIGNADEAVAALTLAIAENTVNRTFMTGIRDFMSAMSPSPTQESDLRQFAARLAGGFIPYSGAQRDIRKTVDPVMREAFTFTEKLRNQVPFLSEDLPPRLDVFGDEITYEQVFNPWYVSQETDDPLVRHVADLAESTQSAVISMPKKIINGISLSSSEYHDYVNLSRNIVEIDGVTFKQKLIEVVSDPAYAAMLPPARVDAIKDVQSKYDMLARNEIINPKNKKWSDFQSRFTAKTIDNAQKYGGDEAAAIAEQGLQELGF